MPDARKAIYLGSYFIDSDLGSFTNGDNLLARVDIIGIKPPFALAINSVAAGANPAGVADLQARIENGFERGPDNLSSIVYADSGVSTTTAQTGTGVGTNLKTWTTPLTRFVRPAIQGTATAWNGGLNVYLWLYGDVL